MDGRRRSSREGAWLTFMFCSAWVFAIGPVFAGDTVEKPLAEVGWSVVFLGREYDPEIGMTRFRYQVTVAGWEKDLSHWVLEFDSAECIPVSEDPGPTSCGPDPTTGIDGFKWDAGQAAGTSQVYSVSVCGDVSPTMASFSVKGGTYHAIGHIQGPGRAPPPLATTCSIEGRLFVDAWGDGVMTEAEPRLEAVTVELHDRGGNLLGTAVTGANGAYRFDGLAPGAYSLSVPPGTSAADLNENLVLYFEPAGSTSRGVELTEASSHGNDFGFRVRPGAVLGALRPAEGAPTLIGAGKTIGFWKHQHEVAISGRGKAQVSAAQLLRYLAAVQALHLPDPFRFGTGREYRDALLILDSRSSEAIDLLEKQLLATELNHVSGQGLADLALQSVLLAWGEYLACHHASYGRGSLLAAKDVMDAINNSGH